ncbi:hypothetical protein [Ornithobacterium rhinotracheale]|uniref:Uncharacterized protein n=1 Tax=Ornithobacterium rhinotracheale (strain ATCC 51463 / DSM 15997 / CCUG 23171 / CIP 104009 / LMG 9086) TaxID=867902 RepID=I4A1C5_ORNRL|nr:hypothetical protein [Ornithobacterium rhinotracheale]AFL97759.1 hypothetical protein Ornrh_1601 [Ornithobacterium rhinotracheale DSM 15997]AIQ00593.1 hypothetical protein Q785_07845 [Ornithobacterium rhinotracheale ORT-UMN 88]KGB66775.1 hypothetical protein Q787_07745 [Ornithobacterium rhinotracheale H06-030791]MCK0193942.1 hypothetical protein [Ornithobacterium rhinotracheale]MCK0200112.1 hypothetical protein [Ornithobacterium rhinotracheale]
MQSFTFPRKACILLSAAAIAMYIGQALTFSHFGEVTWQFWAATIITLIIHIICFLDLFKNKALPQKPWIFVLCLWGIGAFIYSIARQK